MTQFYSRNDTTFQGDSIFTIPFSYIKQEDINIFVNDELIKDWLWLNETQVSITKELTLGDLISIRRQTPIDEKIVDYQNMSMVLDDNNLNLSQDQNIYSIQELYDSNEQFKINTNETLASNKVELENIIETNRQELLDIQTNFENETNIKFDDYKTELNTKIETVAEAADKINELEEAVGIATEAASVAINKAEEAANIADTADKNMQAKLEEATTLIDNKITSNDVTMQEVLTQAEEILSETESVLEETKDTLSNTLTKSQITNCITEIPQRIKADVVDGTLTVYAGTVGIVPYGTTDRTSEFPVGSTFIHENFKVVDTQYTVDEDGKGQFIVWVEVQNNTVVSATWGTNEQVGVYLSIGDGTIGTIGTGRLTSGTTAPTATNRQMWYDTENNIINNYSGSSLIGNNYSFPFIIATSAGDNATITSIDKTFNGIGYIGSTIWVEKGVKGLIPNDRNEDGTLKNIEFISTKFKLLNATSSSFMFSINPYEGGLKHYFRNYVYEQDTPPNVTTHCFWHDTLNNQWKFHGANDTVWKDFYPLELGTGSLTDGKITSFDVKQPFRAVDYSDLGNIYTTTKATTTSSASANRPAVIVQNYVNGKTWYRVWSDGWIEQGGNKLGTASDTVTLPKAFTTTDYTLVANDCFVHSTDSSGAYAIGLVIRSTSKFQIYASKGGVGVSWYACGY